MKNRNLLMQVKAYTNHLFFHGCRWSMLITAYALIAVIIVMSSETYFSEGVYAAEVAYSTEAYDFTDKNKEIMCFSYVSSDEAQDAKTPDSTKMQEEQSTNVQPTSFGLSAMAYHENNSVIEENGEKQNQDNQINVNILDSVVSDGNVKTTVEESAKTTEGNQEESKASNKKTKSSKANQEESIEAFQGTENKSAKIQLSSTDKAVLMRIVEAEATGEDIKGKMLVANVILNRINNSKFPDTVEEVVFQKSGSVYQFSPIKDGRYYKVNISEETKKAVNRVLNGEDESQGALYFMSRSKAKASSVTWFDRTLTKVFKYGTHEFYK